MDILNKIEVLAEDMFKLREGEDDWDELLEDSNAKKRYRRIARNTLVRMGEDVPEIGGEMRHLFARIADEAIVARQGGFNSPELQLNTIRDLATLGVRLTEAGDD